MMQVSKTIKTTGQKFKQNQNLVILEDQMQTLQLVVIVIIFSEARVKIQKEVML